MNPEQYENNPIQIKDVSDKPKKLRVNLKSKRLKVLAIVLAGIVLVGGITAALVVRSIYNRPENVVATALGNYFLDGGDKKFDATVDMGLAEATSGVDNVNLKLGVQTAGDTTQLDFEANLSIFTLKGAVQSNENGNIYIQVKDLQSLLGSSVAQIPGLTDEMKQQLVGLDSKWVEITKEDMASWSGQETGTSEFDKCLDTVHAALDDEKLGDQVDKIYRKNKFILANSSSTEVVNGKELLKVDVGLDKEKLKSFVQEVVKSDKVEKVVTDCDLRNSDSDNPGDSSDGLKDGKLLVWVDRGKKQLVKLEASGSSPSADESFSKVKLTMVVDRPSGKLEAPKDVVNIKDLMQTFGIDPSIGIDSSILTSPAQRETLFYAQ